MPAIYDLIPDPDALMTLDRAERLRQPAGFRKSSSHMTCMGLFLSSGCFGLC